MSLSAPAIRARKRRNGSAPLVMVTAYDEPGARYVDAAGVDIILVGDSLANVVLGHEDTLHVTIEQMCYHVRAVAAAKPRAHVVADMPWLSYHVGVAEAVRNAASLIRSGAQSVKLEGGRVRRDVIRALLDAEIPVMGHLGLTPQSVLTFGGFKVQAKTREAAEWLIKDATLLQDEGVYALVVEGVPSVVGTRITEALEIPTIGIGAGPECDGQVLVFHDLVGLTPGHKPKFARQYVNLAAEISRAVTSYCDDVRRGDFPSDAESFHSPAQLREQLLARQRT